MENPSDKQKKKLESNKNDKNEIKDQNEIEAVNINTNKLHKRKKTKENNNKQKYLSKIQCYINLSLKLGESDNITPEIMDNLLSIITEEKIIKWENKLYNDFKFNKIITEEMILNAKKDSPYQSVIINDAKRTRFKESFFIPNYKDILENILNFYCISNNIYYKQGLNEIFGPLLLLKYKIKKLKLPKILLFGEIFIEKFLPNYYYEKDFCAFKSSLRLFLILLKYHEPSVYNLLDKNEILPEMYATNWLITLMSGKLSLDILFLLWDFLIENDDPIFIHFILVSLLKQKREIIINCDKTWLPQLMSNLTIFEKDELNSIIEMAKDLRTKTPYSFRILAYKLGVLIPRCSSLKERFEKYKPEIIQAIPIFPQEIFYMSNKQRIICPNPDCVNGKNLTKFKLDFETTNKKEENAIEENKYKCICEKCDMKIEKQLNYVLIDLTMTENKEYKMDKDRFWKKVIEINQEELKSEEINEKLAEKLIEQRGKYHFNFLTSTTDYFSKFESDFYKINISEEDKLKMIYGLMEQKKEDKELDLNAGNLSKKEIYKLKEYDNLRKTLKSMQNQNYPYISFVYGGYYKIHEESINMDLEMPSHDIETCEACNQNVDKNEKEKIKDKEKEKNIEKEKKKLYKLLWEHKKKIKYQNLETYFKDSNISILFGSLNEYKGKNLSFEKIQILIAIIFSKYKIEIYKFDIKKQHNSNKTNYYDLGLNFEQQKDIDLIILEELKITDILGMSIEKKVKNVININIKEKNLQKGNKKEEILKYHSYNMIIDLSSSVDAKNFFKSFQKMSSEFKEHINKSK